MRWVLVVVAAWVLLAVVAAVLIGRAIHTAERGTGRRVIALRNFVVDSAADDTSSSPGLEKPAPGEAAVEAPQSAAGTPDRTESPPPAMQSAHVPVIEARAPERSPAPENSR